MEKHEWNNIVRALTEQDNADTAPSFPGVDPEEVRQGLVQRYGEVWTSFTLARDFDVEAFSGSHVIVQRRADGVKGQVSYINEPRYYYRFQPT